MTDPMMEKAREITKIFLGSSLVSQARLDNLTADIALALREAVEDEREACAKLFTSSEQNWWQRKEIAKAIRSRSNKGGR